jgi:hypothetical protein
MRFVIAVYPTFASWATISTYRHIDKLVDVSSTLARREELLRCAPEGLQGLLANLAGCANHVRAGVRRRGDHGAGRSHRPGVRFRSGECQGRLVSRSRDNGCCNGRRERSGGRRRRRHNDLGREYGFLGCVVISAIWVRLRHQLSSHAITAWIWVTLKDASAAW